MGRSNDSDPGKAVAVLSIGILLLAAAWGATALGEGVSGMEEAVFRFFNRWPDWVRIPAWPVMQLGSLAGVALVGLLVAAFGRWWVTGAVCVAGPAAWGAAKLLKAVVGRGRPQDLLSDTVLRPAWEGFGFPSGHAAVAFAVVAVAVVVVGPRGAALLWSAAAAVGVLRMYVGAHFPLDVLGGTGLGLAVGGTTRLGLCALQSTRRRMRGEGGPLRNRPG